MNPPEKVIAVTCKTIDSMELENILPFQGGLKARTEKDLNKIKKSLLKYGICFPFFVWEKDGHCFCMDGHGRRLALIELRESGYTVPPVPVVHIQAESESDAKQKMLRLNSRYGMVTKGSVLQFAGVFDIDIGIDLEYPDIPGSANMFFDADIKDIEMYFDELSIGDKKRNKSVKTCPHCGKVLP